MKKIFLNGYWESRNFGDDLILLNIVNLLKEITDKYKIYYLSNKNIERKFIKNKIERFPRYKFFRLLQTIDKENVLINVGGIFQNRTGILSFLFYFFINFLFILKKAKILSLSVDISDLKGCISNSLFKYIIKKSSLTIMRDRYSYDKLKDFKNVYYANDIGFLIKKRVSIKKKNITTVILKYRKGIGNVIKLLEKKNNIFYIIMPDDYKRLSKYFSKRNYWIYDGDIEKFIRYIKVSNNIISMRLHSGIVAFIYGKPLKFLSDEMKIVHFAQDNNIEILDIKMKKSIDILKFKRYIKINYIRKYQSEWNGIRLKLRKIL